MAFLLDTNVVSELRKRQPDPRLVAWYEGQPRSSAFVSALVVGEIRQGIERLRPRDLYQAEVLERWLAGLVTGFRDRILPVTMEVAEEWGRMNVPPDAPPVIDGLMAATARVHHLTFATRNVANVATIGVDVVNPFDPS